MTLHSKFSCNRDGLPGFRFQPFELDLTGFVALSSATSYETIVEQAVCRGAELESQIVSAGRGPMAQSQQAQAARG